MIAPGPSCLLVIPSFRDGARLEPFLRELMRRLPGEFSIQVVDDGSGAEEAARLTGVTERVRREFASAANGPRLLEPMLAPVNRGKGAAIRAGWRDCASYDLAGFVDADGAISAGEVRRGYQYLCDRREERDGLIASRVAMLGKHVSRNFVRHVIGRVFATAVTLLSKTPVYDSQCGFKLFKSASLAAVMPRLASRRFSFDVELILELRASGARLHEFPIDWVDQPGSKVSVPREMFPMLWDVWRTSRRVRRRAERRG